MFYLILLALIGFAVYAAFKGKIVYSLTVFLVAIVWLLAKLIAVGF